MEITYLREFILLSETCNFSAAAATLGISQPTLTKHVKQLEAFWGAKLLLRSTREVELSEDGKIFLSYAHQITDLFAELHSQLSHKEEPVIPSLCIATIPSMIRYNISELLADFLSRQKVDLKILEQETDLSKSMLTMNQCDFAFVQEEATPDPADSSFDSLPFTEDYLTAVIPANHPLAGNTAITFKHLEHMPLLTLAAPSMINTLCIQHCQKSGFTPDIIMTSPRPQTLLQLVVSGKGIAILMKKQIMYSLRPEIVTVDITPVVKAKINLIYSRKKTLPEICHDFLAYYKAEYGKYSK